MDKSAIKAGFTRCMEESSEKIPTHSNTTNTQILHLIQQVSTYKEKGTIHSSCQDTEMKR